MEVKHGLKRFKFRFKPFFMKQIPLTKGRFAIVDDEDYERLIAHNWQAMEIKGKVYACRRKSGRGSPKELMHRQILNLNDSNVLCDHRDGNGLNNQKENLRTCNQAQNLMNRGANKNSSTGIKGVFMNNTGTRWRAYIGFKGKMKYLGSFRTPLDAATAYNTAAKELHGDFAQLNNVNHGRIS